MEKPDNSTQNLHKNTWEIALKIYEKIKYIYFFWMKLFENFNEFSLLSKPTD